MTTSEAEERMALARELGLSPDRRQWGTVTAAVRRLRSYAAAWDAAADAQADAELERRAVALFAQVQPGLVATLRELVAAGQRDDQILGRPAINAALERAPLTRALIEAALRQIRAGELREGADDPR
jgi:hypothetical protein